jgi:hypothetical protein
MTNRYLNVQYGTRTAKVDVTGISRLGGVKRAVKANFGDDIPVDAALIQLYNQQGQFISDLDDITELYYE